MASIWFLSPRNGSSTRFSMRSVNACVSLKRSSLRSSRSSGAGLQCPSQELHAGRSEGFWTPSLGKSRASAKVRRRGQLVRGKQCAIVARRGSSRDAARHAVPPKTEGLDCAHRSTKPPSRRCHRRMQAVGRAIRDRSDCRLFNDDALHARWRRAFPHRLSGSSQCRQQPGDFRL